MSNEQKSTRKESSTLCGDMPFAVMMEQMMDQPGQGCGCMGPGVLSQMMGQQGMGCDCGEMMAMCGAAGDEEETTPEATQRA